jgi:hypothetical protein
MVLNYPPEKDNFMQNIRSLRNLVGQYRWILRGDFNIIVSLEEKRGGIQILDKESDKFQNLIKDLHLIDIEAQNGVSTWSNKQFDTHQVSYRMDQFMVSESLVLEDLLSEASFLPKSRLDHWPIQLWIETTSTPKYKPFWFENFWLTHLDFLELSIKWW